MNSPNKSDKFKNGLIIVLIVFSSIVVSQNIKLNNENDFLEEKVQIIESQLNELLDMTSQLLENNE